MIAAERILVRAPNWAGDLVMATPAFRALRCAYPRATLAVHVRAGLEELLAGAPWFDRVIPLRNARRRVALLREAFELRPLAFDLGICLPDSLSSSLVMRCAGVRTVVGYRRAGRGVLLSVPVEPPAGWIARERHVLGLTEAIGCSTRGTHLELYTTPAEEARAGELLEAHGIGADAPLTVLAPGASYGPSKLWPPEHFARVGDALAERGARVVVVGTASEAALARAVDEAMRAPTANLTGSLGLGPLKALIRRSRLLVCNDAGTRHIAVAFGVPCVVLFGPTSLAKTNLNLEPVTPLVADVDCRPCYQRTCPTDHRCMTRLDPERVIAASTAAYGRGARSEPKASEVHRARSEPAGCSERTGSEVHGDAS